MVGAVPVIWSAKEGEPVTAIEEMTDSTRIEVFLQFTAKMRRR